MAVADAPGLMDIASTLAQDEIPFKLRCAICNNLAVNAFRLPCCDQSTCETCQASLSDTCPVCTHTPVSPDLCKPNKALRTTLKAFLRTEEKKREKDRQCAAPPSDPAPADANPAESTPQNGEPTSDKADTSVPPEAVQIPSEASGAAAPAADASTANAAESVAETAIKDAEKAPQPEAAGNETNGTEATLEPAVEKPTESVVDVESASAPGAASDINSAPTPNAGGNFPMGWNGNAVNPYMTGMFNFPNAMGMPMGMDPMADQGTFGDFGMNMTGMGMNSGNYNGGMYGSLGWDPSQNNNMWQGAQNKFNPNAFANGTGPYGGTFGSNMSAYPSNYQSGYYGGYGRGNFRGRGRGQNQGYGRYGPNYYHSNSGYPSNPGADQGNLHGDAEGDAAGNPDSQVQGIPTIDGDQPMPFGSNGPSAPGPGVEGAPAAPRAMREGLPNTSVYRQRVQVQGRGSNSSDPETKANTHVQSESRRGSPPHPDSRPRSPSVHGTEDERVDPRVAEPKRMDRVDELQSVARRSRSPSRTSSRRSSRRRNPDDDRERDRKDSHRSHRSRRRRSRSSSRHGDHRPSARLGVIPEHGSSSRAKMSSDGPEPRDLASRISGTRRSDKDRVDRREDDRSRGSNRDSRRHDRGRDRDQERDRDRRDRDRDTDRDRRREDRDKDRAADRDRDRRDHARDRERDRKRSRRDRSQSVNIDHPQARRMKRDEDRTGEQSNGAPAKGSEPEKDPYTLEREARNKERLQREKQHREKANSGRRRESRQDRLVAGRRINYKYEDEL